MIRCKKSLSNQYPRWGREKLRILLHHEGITLSAKTIDRKLTRLHTSGQLVEPPRQTISVRRPRPSATRKPRDYAAMQPGDLVQVDALDVRSLRGVVLKQVPVLEAISRWDVIETYRRATSVTATQFLVPLQ